MFDFLKKNAASAAESSDRSRYPAAPGTQIRFDPHLIEQLTTDHRVLLETYGEVKAAFDGKDLPRVGELLDDFRAALQGHLLTENVRLYIYLEHQLAEDALNRELIRGFRRDMDAIGKSVLGFFRKYETLGADRELTDAFGSDLAAIGEVLTERVRKEEEILYPLYTPIY